MVEQTIKQNQEQETALAVEGKTGKERDKAARRMEEQHEYDARRIMETTVKMMDYHYAPGLDRAFSELGIALRKRDTGLDTAFAELADTIRKPSKAEIRMDRAMTEFGLAMDGVKLDGLDRAALDMRDHVRAHPYDEGIYNAMRELNEALRPRTREELEIQNLQANIRSSEFNEHHDKRIFETRIMPPKAAMLLLYMASRGHLTDADFTAIHQKLWENLACHDHPTREIVYKAQEIASKHLKATSQSTPLPDQEGAPLLSEASNVAVESLKTADPPKLKIS